MTPKEEQKLYELAKASRASVLGDAPVDVGNEQFKQLVELREAVLSLCKPPEPEKVEAWGIVNGEGRIAGLHELLTGAKESLAKLNRDGSLPPYSITYLSGIEGQGKPEEGE